MRKHRVYIYFILYRHDKHHECAASTSIQTSHTFPQCTHIMRTNILGFLSGNFALGVVANFTAIHLSLFIDFYSPASNECQEFKLVGFSYFLIENKKSEKKNQELLDPQRIQ